MIFEIYIWILSFVSVFMAVLWIMVNYAVRFYKTPEPILKNYPLVTIAVPAWNEENTIIPTLRCILDQNYPERNIEVIVVDDKSKDKTNYLVKDFISKNKSFNIKLINHKKNTGKAGALNSALRVAKGEFFWVYDADSFASRDLLRNLVKRFYEPENKDVAAVVAITLIKNDGNWVSKMQRLEYVMASFVRKLLGSVDTLHITNALTLFKTATIKKIGGFDVGNLTEDFEMAMKLRYNGFRIVMCENGNFHTNVPATIKRMWLQRVRWFRGFIHNNLKYKRMIMNKQFGLLGLFQIPVEIFFLLAVFTSVVIFGYHFINLLIDLGFQVYIQRLSLLDFSLPTFKYIILNINWKITFPSFIVLFFGLYLYFAAHKYVGEKWKFYIPSLIYIFVYPLFRSMQWVHAFVLELGRAERKW